MLSAFHFIQACLQGGILVPELVDMLTKDAEERFDGLETALVVQMTLFGALRRCIERAL